MRPAKGKSIVLFKEKPNQTISGGFLTSRQKMHLKDSLRHIQNGSQTSRVKPSSSCLNNLPYTKACNMQDQQIRIKREYSPLYQKSTQQSQLFQKGVKKAIRNINLESRINLTENDRSQRCQISTINLKRQDPNQKSHNILTLGSQTEQISPLKLKNKRDPNKAFQFKDQRKARSQIKDKNVESTQTGDYVIKTLSNHISTVTKQLHIKFTKKQNLPNTENLPKHESITTPQPIVPNHKRHFSHILSKQNIEVQQNGFSLKKDFKQDKKHFRNEFNHDFYKKTERMNCQTARQGKQNKAKHEIHQKNITGKLNYKNQIENRPYMKTEHFDSNSISRVAQLRKRLL